MRGDAGAIDAAVNPAIAEDNVSYGFAIDPVEIEERLRSQLAGVLALIQQSEQSAAFGDGLTEAQSGARALTRGEAQLLSVKVNFSAQSQPCDLCQEDRCLGNEL